MNYETDINSSLNSAKKSKLIKKTVMAAYPDTKFSVTCDHYSGGFSFDIKWTNGPTASEIDKILEQFKDNREYNSYFVHSTRNITDEVWKWSEKQIEAITGAPFNERSSDHTKRLVMVANTDLRGLF